MLGQNDKRAAWKLYGILHDNPQFFIRPLEQVETEAITQAMILCEGNLDLAAARLGILKARLIRKLKVIARKTEA